MPTAQRMLAQRKPKLVIAAQTPLTAGPAPLTTMLLLRREYRLVAAVAGVPIYHRLQRPRRGILAGPMLS